MANRIGMACIMSSALPCPAVCTADSLVAELSNFNGDQSGRKRSLATKCNRLKTLQTEKVPRPRLKYYLQGIN